jgi:hypothetical protein
VTLSAIVIELARHMIRVGRRVKVIGVAIKTLHRKILILIVHMALTARRRNVSTREREPRASMTEGRWQPRCRGVTRQAIMVEVARNVIRVLRLPEIRLVTRIAIRKHQLVVAVHVA